MRKGNSTWKVLSWLSFIISLIPLGLGFYKMFVYENGEYYPYEYINTYVGGDAYNYIINGNYATAFFVLASLFVVMGIGFAVLFYLSKMDHLLTNLAPVLRATTVTETSFNELPDL